MAIWRRVWAILLGAVLALITARPASAQTQAPAHQYVLAFQTPGQDTIVDLASRSQYEVTLSFNVMLLRKTPARLSDMDAYWADGVLQIECLDHHTRMMLKAGYTLDRGRRFDEPNPAFEPWSDDVEGTQALALEAFVCRGKGAASFERIDDLGRFTRDFVGDAAVASAIPPPRAAAPSAPAAKAGADQPGTELAQPGAHPQPKGMSRYYATIAHEEGASLLDMTSTVRRGQVVSVTELILSTQPLDKARPQFRWLETEVQYDCAGHRFREAARAMMTPDRKSRTAFSPVTWDVWNAIIRGGPDDRGEALVCRGKTHDDTLLPTDDLDEFQLVLAQALADRAKK
jgi:hypothetical protein